MSWLRRSGWLNSNVLLKMKTFTVRCLIQWKKRKGQKLENLYEERITAWEASSFDEAIELAEFEVQRYAKKEGFTALDLCQAFSPFENFSLPHQGVEIFSLLRESNLDPETYLDTFFDTESERMGKYGEIE